MAVPPLPFDSRGSAGSAIMRAGEFEGPCCQHHSPQDGYEQLAFSSRWSRN